MYTWGRCTVGPYYSHSCSSARALHPSVFRKYWTQSGHLLSIAANLGHVTQVKHSSFKSSATHSCQCVQHFYMSKQWYACQCWGFLMCTQVLMHVIAHGGCMDTVRVCTGSWLEGKIPCCNRDLNPLLYCTWVFSWTLYQLNCPFPMYQIWIRICHNKLKHTVELCFCVDHVFNWLSQCVNHFCCSLKNDWSTVIHDYWSCCHNMSMNNPFISKPVSQFTAFWHSVAIYPKLKHVCMCLQKCYMFYVCLTMHKWTTFYWSVYLDQLQKGPVEKVLIWTAYKWPW